MFVFAAPKPILGIHYLQSRDFKRTATFVLHVIFGLSTCMNTMTGLIFSTLLSFLVISANGFPFYKQKVIDLGYSYNNETQWWPNMTKYEVILQSRTENENGIPWFAYNVFETSEHVGTHVDAPFHFDKDGWKLGDIPQERFFAPGVHIDVSDLVGDNYDFVLEPKHIRDWERKHGKIQKNSIVIVSFGWSEKFYTNRDIYYGLGKTNGHDLNFPGFGQEAAELFVSRGIYGVGLDTPSMDPGKVESFLAHQTILGGSLFGIENLDLSSKEIPAKHFDLHVMPMKISEGTGAPARVFAFV